MIIETMLTRAQSALFFSLSASMLLAACGDGLDPAVGSYEGEIERFNATNFGMTTNTEEVVITITPSASDEATLIIGLDEDCSLRAAVDGESLTISEQACEFSGQRTADTWNYKGTGAVTKDGTFTLEVGGTFTRTYTDNSGLPPLMGNHTVKFTGSRL